MFGYHADEHQSIDKDQSIGFGGKEWPNLQSVCSDAFAMHYYKQRWLDAQYLLAAIASTMGTLRYTETALQAKLGPCSTGYDPTTRQTFVYPPEKDGPSK